MKYSSLYEHIKILGDYIPNFFKFDVITFDNMAKSYVSGGLVYYAHQFKHNIEMGIVLTPNKTTST